MVLELKATQTPERALLALSGELDISEAARVERELARLEAQRPPELVLDLSGLSFMDSTGLRLIIAAHQRVAGDGRRLLVVRGPEAVQRIFSVTRLEDRLEFLDALPD